MSDWTDQVDAMMGEVVGAFGVAITLKARTDSGLTASTGSLGTSFTDINLNANRLPTETFDARGGETEQVSYSLRAADVLVSASRYKPRPGDKVVDGTRTRTVAEVKTACDEAEWVVVCRDIVKR